MSLQKSLFLGISLLLVLPFLQTVSASPLYANQSTIDLNVTKGVSKTIPVRITNPNNYTLYDVQIQGDFVTTSPINLDPNQSSEVSMIVAVSSTGIYEKTLKIVGFTKVNCSMLTSTTREINITQAGASPRSIEVCRNTNVRFNNNYGSSIYFVIESQNLSQPIGVNASHVQVYSSLGLIPFKIEPLIDMGYVTVVDNQQNVFDTSTEGSFILRVKSSLEETNLSMNFNKISFNVSYNELGTSFFTVKNVGSKVAEKINLYGSDGWFSFDKNNFNLNPNEEIAVNFVVSPKVTLSSETGLNYSKTITLMAENVKAISQNISVFIPYAQIASGNMSSPEWWLKRKEFCDKYPSAPDCLTEPLVVYRNVPEFACPDILMNMSPIEVKKYLEEVRGLREDWNTLVNPQKLDMEIMKNQLSNLADQTNRSITNEETNKKSLLNIQNTLYFVMGIGLLGVVSAFIGYGLFKKYRKQKLLNLYNAK